MRENRASPSVRGIACITTTRAPAALRIRCAARCDLPMPGSPSIRTARPKPFAACDHISSSCAISSVRPLVSVLSPRSRSSRVDADFAPIARQARVTSGKPLSDRPSTGSYSKAKRVREKVAGLTNSVLVSAAFSNRAARFGATPTAPNLPVARASARSGTTTMLVAIPTRRPGAPSISATASSRARPDCTADSAASSRASG